MNVLQETIRRLAEDAVARYAQPRHGLVQSVDPAQHLVRVEIQPEGVVTGWIPDCSIAAGAGLRVAMPSEIGTQVLVVPGEGDEGTYRIVGRLFDDETPPPVSAVTGKPAQPGEMLAVSGSATVHLSASSITLMVGQVKLTLDSGGLHLTGALDATGNITSTGGDVKAQSISLTQHTHSGVQSGSSNTGLPQ